MRKLLSLITLMALLVVSACSDTSGSNKSSDDNEGVSITLGLWDEAQVSAYEPVIEKFEEENPNITVKVQPTPWDQYWTKLDTAATSDVLPDVFWMNGPNFNKYASNGILLPLDKYIEQGEIDLDNYPEALIDLYTYNEQNFAIPKDFDTIGLFYNKELFDEAGIEYPDETWGWDEVTEAAKKLTNKEDGIYGIASHLNNQAGYYNTIYQAGGYILSEDQTEAGFDEPATIEGLQFWTDLIHKHEVSPTLAQMTDTKPRQFFESGKVAMVYDGTWMAGVYHETLQDKVDVAVLPKGKERATIIHGIGHAISANSKHQDESWKLLEFLSSKEAGEMFAETGMFIPAYNGTEDEWIESIPNMNLQAFIDMLDYSVPYPANENTPEWQTLEYDVLPKAWTGEESVEQNAEKLNEAIEKVLEN